jgi:AcrR family transcriptional regulator
MGAISPPSFYAAFESKQQLFRETVDLYLETVGHRPIQALESATTAREGVEAMLQEIVDICSGPNTPRGCLLFLGAINCAPANKSIQDYMRPFRVQAPDMIRKRLRRAVAEGDVPKDIETTWDKETAPAHRAQRRERERTSKNHLDVRHSLCSGARRAPKIVFKCKEGS